MNVSTPFGMLALPPNLRQGRLDPVQRALSWCDELATLSGMWDRRPTELGVELVREINNKTLAINPLEAACLDTGIEVRGLERHHLPVTVNGFRICIVPERQRGQDLHTDLVASFILLFSQEHPPHAAIPKPLLRALFPETYRLSRRDHGYRPAHYGRREEIFEAFAASARTPQEAIAHVEAMPPEDWRILRDYHPWEEDLDLAIDLATELMDDLERPVNDHLWIMNLFREHLPHVHETNMLPAYVRFIYPEVRRQALLEYRPQNPEVAWTHLEACLEDEVEDLCIMAHSTLQSYPGLNEQLTKKTIELVAEFNPGPFQRHMVAWLSQEHDVDGLIQEILPTLEPHEMRRFLDQIKTYDPWFENFCKVWLKSSFEGLHAGIVKCSATNMSFNPFNLWLPLMKNGSGSLKVAILANLHRLTDEQAYQLLKLGWTSRWRFVIRRTHAIVEKHYPDYPEKEAMLKHGLQSAEYWTKNRS